MGGEQMMMKTIRPFERVSEVLRVRCKGNTWRVIGKRIPTNPDGGHSVESGTPYSYRGPEGSVVGFGEEGDLFRVDSVAAVNAAFERANAESEDD